MRKIKSVGISHLKTQAITRKNYALKFVVSTKEKKIKVLERLK